MLNRIKNSRGFSLIELAVVLIIIGVIAAIAIPTFQTVIDKSEQRAVDSTADALVRNLDALGAFENGALTNANVFAAMGEAAGIAAPASLTAAETGITGNGYSFTLTAAGATDVAAGDTIAVTKGTKTATVTLGSPRSNS